MAQARKACHTNIGVWGGEVHCCLQTETRNTRVGRVAGSLGSRGGKK